MFICSVLVACNNTLKVKETFTGTIEEVHEYEGNINMLVLADTTTGEGSGLGLVSLGVPDGVDETFRVGDRVKVGYDGTVMEIAPPAVKAITLEKIE